MAVPQVLRCCRDPGAAIGCAEHLPMASIIYFGRFRGVGAAPRAAFMITASRGPRRLMIAIACSMLLMFEGGAPSRSPPVARSAEGLPRHGLGFRPYEQGPTPGGLPSSFINAPPAWPKVSPPSRPRVMAATVHRRRPPHSFPIREVRAACAPEPSPGRRFHLNTPSGPSEVCGLPPSRPGSRRLFRAAVKIFSPAQGFSPEISAATRDAAPA